MCLNNKGFAITTILYGLLLMATLILFLLIGNLSFERRTTDEFVENIKNELNGFTNINDTSNIITVKEDETYSGVLKDINNHNVAVGDKIKLITPINENYLISIKDNNITHATPMILLLNNNSDSQSFTIRPSTTDTYYYIATFSNPGFVMDIAGGSTELNTKIQLYTTDDVPAQKWQFVETDKVGVYTIRSALGTCMDLFSALASGGSAINSYDCNNSNAQKWKVLKV